jgi:hypothetical protein
MIPASERAARTSQLADVLAAIGTYFEEVVSRAMPTDGSTPLPRNEPGVHASHTAKAAAHALGAVLPWFDDAPWPTPGAQVSGADPTQVPPSTYSLWDHVDAAAAGVAGLTGAVAPATASSPLGLSAAAAMLHGLTAAAIPPPSDPEIDAMMRQWQRAE